MSNKKGSKIHVFKKEKIKFKYIFCLDCLKLSGLRAVQSAQTYTYCISYFLNILEDPTEACCTKL